jgi:hypothetical protein
MIQLNYTYRIFFTVEAAGVGVAADATPVAVLYRNGSASGVTVTVAATATTGLYQATFTTDSGWSKTDVLHLSITATINSTNGYVAVVWDSTGNADAVMRGTDNVDNTAIADAVWDEPYADHKTAGSMGKLIDLLRKSNRVIEGELTGVPTTTVLSTNLSGYPAGAFDHELLLVNGSGIARPILSYNANGTITLQEPLPEAPEAGDDIIIIPSHIHPVEEIAEAVRTELTTELDEIGSIKSKTDQLTFTDNSVNATLTNDSIQEILDSIPINISVGIASNDSTIKTTKLQVNQGETINQSIAVFLSDLSTPVDLSGKTLEILFENKNEEFVALIENANITLSGENNNVVTFSYPIEVTRTLENKIWSLRDTDETKKVYSKGVLDILRAANKRE